MNVAFVVAGFPSLSETFILNQITGLLDRGIHVEIFAQFNPKEKKIHPDIKKYDLETRVFYFPSIPKNRLIRVLKGLWLILMFFGKDPSRVLRCLNVFRFGRDALSLKMLYANISLLGKTFDILHCHFGQNGIIGGFLKKAGAGKKLITVFHGYDLSEFLRLNGDDVYQDLFKTCDLCLPISHYWERRLMGLVCQREKIRVFRMGISMELFRFREREIGRDGPVRILSVGRLVEKKGHWYAIQALARVMKRYPRIEYLVAGDGPLMKPLKELVSSLEIGSRVQFYGECDQQEVLGLYDRSHIFLLPSVTSARGDREGIPVVLMEAQAAGLPVIATRHSGIPEGVRDGESAFLVPERDSDAIADRISYLLNHPGIWGKMGRAGRRLIEEDFNVEKLNVELKYLFEELLERNAH